MLEHEIGMLTTVIIGNSATFLYEGLMITPRGYQRKYTLGQTEQPLKLHQRLQKDAEPWALEQFSQAIGQQNEHKAEVSLREIAELALKAVSSEKHEQIGLSVTNQTFDQIERSATNQTFDQIFELAVSPGVANKQFTAKQMIILAEVVGEKGVIEYTQDHNMKLQVPTSDPNQIIKILTEAGFILSPVGDVLTVKACDFCDGDKRDPIPYAEELQNRLGGMELPKELKLGFNGCGMACYGAVKEDIGIVYRQGAFDLFIGGKTAGRTAHPGQIVAEGIDPSKIVGIVENIIADYNNRAYPNERFYKFFKRVKQVEGFIFVDIMPKLQIAEAACGE